MLSFFFFSYHLNVSLGKLRLMDSKNLLVDTEIYNFLFLPKFWNNTSNWPIDMSVLLKAYQKQKFTLYKLNLFPHWKPRILSSVNMTGDGYLCKPEAYTSFSNKTVFVLLNLWAMQCLGSVKIPCSFPFMLFYISAYSAYPACLAQHPITNVS